MVVSGVMEGLHASVKLCADLYSMALFEMLKHAWAAADAHLI